MLNKNKKRVILIDSHALLHRAYHAMSEFRTRDGRPTGALYGFVRMILSGVKDIDPEYVIACYDLPKPTFRHVAYENYKGTRQKSDDELKVQINQSKKFCAALGIPVVECEGFEADDLLGTLSRQFDPKVYDVVIVSGDMDVMQLVNKNVFVYTMKKGAETDMFDEKKVLEKYSIKPNQIADYKGLAGDAGDNIIGIDGIGDKTAIKLITKYGSIENIYKQIKKDENDLLEVVSARILEKLKNGKDEAEFSKTLATIRLDAPVNAILDCKWPECVKVSDYEKLCDEYELRSLRNRFDYIAMQDGEYQEAAEKKASLEISQKEKDVIHSMYALIDSENNKVQLEELVQSYGATDIKDLKFKLKKELESQNLYEYYVKVDEPILEIVDEMERIGVSVDVKKLDIELEKFKKLIQEKEKEIHTLAGREFLISSPKQLGDVLYDEMGLGVKIKKTSTGKRSTNVEMLESIKGEHPIIEKILEWREVSKLFNTYLEPLKTFVKEDGKVHPKFIPTGAATGRFSCENPNMQNLPTKSEYAIEIKNIFIADLGYKFISLDYSQIDLRAAAILSKDEHLIEIFEKMEDIHTAVAARVLHKKEEEVTKEERRKAKAINFGILYGMGVSALKESMGVERKEAQDFYDTYKSTFTTLMSYLEKVKQDATKSGYTETLFGRRRQVPLLKSKLPFLRAQGERIAINAPIQGTSADIIKLGMIDVCEAFKDQIKNGELRLLLQIHDELVFEAKDGLAKEFGEKIKNIMEKVLEKRDIKTVPLIVSIDVGDRLGEI